MIISLKGFESDNLVSQRDAALTLGFGLEPRWFGLKFGGSAMRTTISRRHRPQHTGRTKQEETLDLPQVRGASARAVLSMPPPNTKAAELPSHSRTGFEQIPEGAIEISEHGHGSVLFDLGLAHELHTT